MAKFALVPVEVRKLDNCGLCYEIIVNGQPLERVRQIDFHAGINEVPTIDVEFLADFHLTDNAYVAETYSDEDIATAARVMSATIRNRQDIRDGFKASILSALHDGMKDGCHATMEDFAETILRRIAG